MVGNERVQDVLACLADLAPVADAPPSGRVVPLEWFRWLPLAATTLIGPEYDDLQTGGAVVPTTAIDRGLGERLAAIDRLRGAGSVRAGWLWVAGRETTANGKHRRVFHPLVTVPVRPTSHRLVGGSLAKAGDAELSPLVTDPAARRRLDDHLEWGGGALGGPDIGADPALLPRLLRLTHFATELAAAAGLAVDRVVPGGGAPDDLMREDGLVCAVGMGVFVLEETGGSARGAELRRWADRPSLGPSAFRSLYLGVTAGGDVGGDAGASDEPVEAPVALTPAQRQCVRSSRTASVTVISGGAGNGKSHTATAIVSDALARGERVLVTAKSDAGVDALVELLERTPGPDPVVFGSSERRSRLANRLAAGRDGARSASEVGLARAAFDDARTERDRSREGLIERVGALGLVDAAVVAERDEYRNAPLLFDPGADLDEASRLLEQASGETFGWVARRRARRAAHELARIGGTGRILGRTELAAALRLARSARLARGADRSLDHLWREYFTAERAAAEKCGAWLAADADSADRWGRRQRSAVAALAKALRSGRSARREQLRALDDAALTTALPLWIGTLGDVDDLLPDEPCLFDLVVVDEASSVEQGLAAAALLRARRCVVIGDPQQLRHVSFTSDDAVRGALAAHGLADDPELSALLDVRRNSLFDVAAAVAPVVLLDEHFRSDPHLVDFVAERLYDGRVRVATRSPVADARRCIEPVRLSGRRDADGVVRGEVDEVVRRLRRLRDAGASSVGVVSPFRAQADALEAAALEIFSADEIEALDLRIGTVHAFQGIERDIVLCSLGIGETDTGSWRFVEDPHLLAVGLTRARRHFVFVHSAEPRHDGILADYLVAAHRLPVRRPGPGPVSPWTAKITGDLGGAGIPVVCSYLTGRHQLDAVVDRSDRCIAIETGVHPDGPEAHVERRLALERSGWTVLDALEPRWRDLPGELVLDLAAAIEPAAYRS